MSKRRIAPIPVSSSSFIKLGTTLPTRPSLHERISAKYGVSAAPEILDEEFERAAKRHKKKEVSLSGPLVVGGGSDYAQLSGGAEWCEVTWATVDGVRRLTCKGCINFFRDNGRFTPRRPGRPRGSRTHKGAKKCHRCDAIHGKKKGNP